MGNGHLKNIVWWEIGTQPCGKLKIGSSVFLGMCHCSRSFIAEVLLQCFIAKILVQGFIAKIQYNIYCALIWQKNYWSMVKSIFPVWYADQLKYEQRVKSASSV